LLHLQNKQVSYLHYDCHHHPHIINSIIVINTIIITITVVIVIVITIFNQIIFINFRTNLLSAVFVSGLLHITYITHRQRMLELDLMEVHVGIVRTKRAWNMFLCGYLGSFPVPIILPMFHTPLISHQPYILVN